MKLTEDGKLYEHCGVTRNFRVVGLANHGDHYTVMTLRLGEEDPNDSGCRVTEFVDLDQLKPGGYFNHYTREEQAILRRGATRDGKDKHPATGRAIKKRPPAPEGLLA